MPFLTMFLRKLAEHWFLVALIAVLALGMCFPAAMRPVDRLIPRGIVVAMVLFLMSISLPANAMWQVVRHPAAALLAVMFNVCLAPPLAWLASRTLDGQLAIGLIIAATVPCTLASAAVWTRRAGGNDAVALLVTMITNVACFAVIPGWLWLLIGQPSAFEHGELMLRLAQICLLPVLLGQLARSRQRVARWVDSNGLAIGIVAQLGILTIVLQGAVHCGEQLATAIGNQVTLATISVVVALAALLHLVLFGAGWFTAQWLHINARDSAAVAMASSQKTLMIGIDVALGFGGLAILPMVAYHAVQLVLDTVLADWLRKKGPKDVCSPN